MNFSFENLHAQGIEDVFLNGAFERSRAINRVVAMARDECFRRVGEFESVYIRCMGEDCE